MVFLRIAIRKLNNSALLAKDISRDKEIIIMGKGISFKYKKGQKISAEDIESVFVLNDRDKSEDYIQQFEQTSQEYVEITQILVDDIQSEFNIVMPELFFTALMDHIQFAVYRCRHNMRIENRMTWILQRMYPEEFKYGEKAIKMIDNYFSIKLPIEEATNIALYIINNENENKKFNDMYSGFELQSNILSIIKYSLNIDFESRNLIIDRFLTHVQFFVQRLLNNEKVLENDIDIISKIVDDFPKEFKCALLIKDYIKKTMDIEISRDELFYLTVHLVRLVKNQKNKENNSEDL